MSFQIDERSIQASLKAEDCYAGALDGMLGPMSMAGVSRSLTAYFPKNFSWVSWSSSRALLAYQQLMMKRVGVEVGDIDGLLGPQTRYAFECWQNHLRGVVPPEAQVAHLPTIWPRQADVPTYYGEKGVNQTKLALPYPMRLAWDPIQTINKISLHGKVADSAGRAFALVLSTYGLESIKRLRLDQFGGSLNVRKMRGGNAWSMHSWGIAIDMDPERNQFRWGRDQAALDHVDYIPWWAIWEREGWVSLGRERNFDWQHFQAARL